MRRLPFVVVASLVGVLAAACGSSSDEGAPNDGSSGGSSGSLGSSSSSSSSGGGATCAATSASVDRASIDIIILIDNSGSMSQETEQVRQNINDFAQAIGKTGLDYNVVMISKKGGGAFGSGICVPPPLAGADCADGPKFHHLAEGVGSEDSLDIILEQYPKYSAWLRPEAHKVFIEVTDDDAELAYTKFDKQLLEKWPEQFGDPQKRRYTFNSICGYTRGTPILSPEKCSSAVNTGDQYQNLSKLTGGTVDSVCETSYASVFDNIAKGIITKLGCEFSFPKADNGQQTDPSTVVVTYMPGDGSAAKPLTQVTDVGKCGANPDGWYYDNPSSPTKVVFCPSTCSGPGADTAGKLDVKVGCAAPPPK